MRKEKQKNRLIHEKIHEKKKNLKDEYLNILKQIFNQSPMLYKLDSKTISVTKGWKSAK